MQHENFIEWLSHHRDQIAIDLLAGSISGIFNCFFAHPLDTVKVRMQISTDSLFQVMRNTYVKEGALAFYKGMEFPLIAVPIINACVFTSYEFWKRILETDDIAPMEYWKVAICGMFAGSATACISSPIELAKCRLQTQTDNHLHGPFNCMRQIIKAEGRKGCFRGMFVTQLREIRGYGAQFPAYEAVKDLLVWFKGSSGPSNFDLLISGGLAGVACWTASFPQDTVKTILQLEMSIKPHERAYAWSKYISDGGYFDCYRKIKQKEGILGLWKGYSACLIRAFYANAIGFYTYEISKILILEKLGRNNVE